MPSPSSMSGGASTQGEDHPVPNPAWLTKGEQQQIWIVNVDSGEPRLLAEGNAPAVSFDGKVLAYVLKGQVWTLQLTDRAAKPEHLVQTRGSSRDLRWSPDSALAFSSNRAITPSLGSIVRQLITDLSRSFHGSRRRSGMVGRRPPHRVHPPGERHSRRRRRSCSRHLRRPWSIRIADATTGTGRESGMPTKDRAVSSTPWSPKISFSGPMAIV